MIYLVSLISKDEPENKGVVEVLCGSEYCARASALFQAEGRFFMSENRLAVISVIIENREQSAKVNAALSDFGDYIVGRMGVPYKERGVSVICVIIDAPNEIINTLTGKIGMLDGVYAKTLTSKIH